MDGLQQLSKTIRGVSRNNPVTKLMLLEIIRTLSHNHPYLKEGDLTVDAPLIKTTATNIALKYNAGQFSINAASELEIKDGRYWLKSELVRDVENYLSVEGVKIKSGYADNAGLLNGLADTKFLRRDIDQTVAGKTDWQAQLTALSGFKAGLAGTAYLEMLADLVSVKKNIGSESYASGFAGSGWRMDQTDNRLTVDYLTVRKEMSVYELIINQIRSTNGALWVSDAAKIASVTDGGSYWKCNLDTDGGNAAPPFVPDDWIRCQKWTGRGIKYYSAKVTSVGADYFNITKTGIDGAGTPAAGDTVVRIGNATNSSRQGAIYLTSSDSNSPYMDVLDGVVSASLTGKTKVRLGKLDGITDPQMGALSGYGLYADNVYLKGIIYVTGGNAETQTGAQTKIDAVKVGGRNLVLNSATRLETNDYHIGTIDLSENIAIGTELTITAWGELASGQNLYVGLFPSTAQVALLEKKGNKYSGTFVFDKYSSYPNDVNNRLVLYNSPLAGNLIGYIEKVKLERGNKATDHTLAEEDVFADATAKANAAQTSAQNYASGLVSGLQVSLGGMAYESLVNLAKLDSTIIQGGYINSSLLDVQAIRVIGALATITEAQGYANAVKVGGRNLLLNSNNATALGNWLFVHTLFDNELITVQVWGNGSVQCYIDNGYSAPQTINTVNGYGFVTYVVKPYTNSPYNNGTVLFICDLDASPKIKVERGNKPTDYSIAEEDVSADATAKANAAQTSAQTYASGLYNSLNAGKQDAIVSGKTLIIGGYLNTDFIQAGSIVASKIVFDGATGNNVNLTGQITANTGKIGGFNISGSGIVNDDGLAYVICRNTADGREAMIGTSVFPLAGSGVSYFRNELYNPYATNYAVYAKARNAGTQYYGEKGYYAGYFDGHVKVVNGDLEVSGQMNGIWNIPDSHIYHMGNAVIVNNLPAGYYLYVGDNKTANRDYQLPDASSYKAGTVIRIVNWNNNDSYIRPYNTQTINGYTKEQRYITLSDPSSTVCLRSNGSNQWTIVYLAGTSVGF